MTTIYLGITALIILIVSFISSLILYKNKNKEKYSLLNMFPYELKVEDYRLNLCSGSCLAVGIGILCVLSLYNYFYGNIYSFLGKSLGVVLILTNIFLLGLFVLDMKNYKAHIFLISIFYVLNFMCYAIMGFICVRAYSASRLWILIVSFTISFIILISMFTPLLNSWYKLKKIEKNGEEATYGRGKVFILSFVEWLNIIVYLLFYVLVIIEPFIR